MTDVRLKLGRTRRTTGGGTAPAGPDAFLESYVSWRAACLAVRSAYDSWRKCEPALRSLAFDSYRAALDREEHAARMHSERTERLVHVDG